MSDRGYKYKEVQNLYALPFLAKEYVANWHFWKDS
jgi:hypothetical protein